MENFVETDFDLARARELHRNGSKIQILLASCAKNKQNYVLKRINISSAQEINSLLKESYAMMEINHKSIIKIHAGLLGERNGSLSHFIFVMDYYPDGDLKKEIKKRQQTQSFWSLQELTKIFKELVAGFGFMQAQDIAHRDISPENILKKGNNYIISDLGHAFKTNSTEILKFTGTSDYLSPKLRGAYITYHQGGIVDKIDHDAYKSDVFSLGLTFLFMASLKNIKQLGLLDEKKYKTLLSYRLAELKYDGTIGKMIGKMLEFNENERFDFKKLCTFCGCEGYEAKIIRPRGRSSASDSHHAIGNNNKRPQTPQTTERNNEKGLMRPQEFTERYNPFPYQHSENLGNTMRSQKKISYERGYINQIPGNLYGIPKASQARPSTILSRRKEIQRNQNCVPNISYSEAPELMQIPNNLQSQIHNCTICNENVCDINFVESSYCSGIAHNYCFNLYSRYEISENFVSYGYYCNLCQIYHLRSSKQLVRCDFCQNLTVVKLNKSYCLKCIFAIIPNYDEERYTFQVLCKLTSVCCENYSSINGFCSYCSGIPDVFMNGNHWLCYQCIFSSVIANGYFKCNCGCCEFV